MQLTRGAGAIDSWCWFCSAVRGELLQQLQNEREKARAQTSEMDYLRGELIAMRDLREQDQQDKKVGKKHEKSEVEAYQVRALVA